MLQRKPNITSACKVTRFQRALETGVTEPDFEGEIGCPTDAAPTGVTEQK